MITYEVHLEITSPHTTVSVDAVERYMRERHIPEILATGCFARIAFERESETHLRTRYQATTREDLDRYLAEHTARLREDFVAHFPEGVTARREVWEEREVWELM